MILREFASPQPMNFFFYYPLHEYDEENILMDTELQGSPVTKKKEGGKTRGEQKSKERDARILDLKNLLHTTLDLAGGRCDMVGGKRAIALALKLYPRSARILYQAKLYFSSLKLEHCYNYLFREYNIFSNRKHRDEESSYIFNHAQIDR